MNNIHILIVIRLSWIVLVRVWKRNFLNESQQLGLGFGQVVATLALAARFRV
jgi:hypothetical protein